MDETKHDFEQTARTTITATAKTSKVMNKYLNQIFMRLNLFMIKRFSASMNALKKDGPTMEVESTPPLTHSEMKEIVAKAKESGVLVGVKEMTPDGDIGRRKSLHVQEKAAKHEINAAKFKERSILFKKIKPLKNYYAKKANSQLALSNEDNFKNGYKRYIILSNKSRVSFLNTCLADIQEKRVSKLKENDLEDINKDGIVDERDIENLKTRGVHMKPSEMQRLNEDYGDCLISEYHQNYCTQRLSKEEYCSMREALFELRSHGAKTISDSDVLVAISNEDLEEYMKYAPVRTPIKEFGSKGGTAIQSVKSNDRIQMLSVKNEQEWKAVKEKYEDRDYIASHNEDGSISFLVLEEDTNMIVSRNEKKTTTEDLLEEAEMLIDKEVEVPDISTALEKTNDFMDEIEDELIK